MNLSLLNPFNTYPTAVQTSLVSLAAFARFDPSGRYVAAGRNDGSTAIWDLDTRAAVRWLEGHVKGVTAAGWSRNSRFVLTASKDWNVVIWDLAGDQNPPQRHSTIRFDAPVLSAAFHPRNCQIMLALLGTGEAYIVDSRPNHRGRWELSEAQDESDDEGSGTPTNSSRSPMTAASFDPSGKHVFVGTAAGSILVFNTRTKTLVARHKITGAGMMKGIEFSRSSRRLVTNSSDRTLRQFNLPLYPAPNAQGEYIEQELEPTHRFNDPINRTQWHAVSYSPDGEWLAGGAADPANHKIYIWDLSNDGNFASALDGGREPLTFVHWHPRRSALVSTTNQGNLLLWHCPMPEKWGAFAGGFEEVDENVEYEEREDEFDIEDPKEIYKRKMKEEEKEVNIDEFPEEDPEVVGRRTGQVWTQCFLGKTDEDGEWAEEDPDEDLEGWRLKIFMEEDD